MLAGGINVAEALEILKRTNERNETLAAAFDVVLRGLHSGHTLSHGFLRFPRIFPQTLTRLVRVGEQSGRLVAAVSLATEWMRRQEELGQKLKKAFSYPVVVVAVAITVNLLVMKFCLPQMRQMIAGFGGEQPLLTQLVFGAGEVMVHPITLILLGTLTLLLWYKRAAILERYGLQIYSALHSMPLIGPMLRCAAMARLCSTLATCLEVNLTFLRSLSLSLAASGDPLYEKSGNVIAESIKDGDSLAISFRMFPHLYPGVVWQAVEVGEESGRMPQALRSVTKLLEEELDHRIEVLTHVLEPLVLVICSIFVGVFVLAIFLPLQGFLAQIAS